LRNEDELRKVQEAEIKVRSILRSILDEKGYERMTNVKLANYQLYFNAASYLVNIYKRTNERINEETVIDVLRGLSNKQRGEIEIKRK